MSPEIIGEVDYDGKVDVWSAGVVTYVLLSGKPPFYGQDQKEVYNSILNSPLRFDDDTWKEVSTTAKDFLQKVLKKNPEERLSSIDALNHPWLQ